KMIDVFTGEEFKTWVFVMVLSWSRHMYAELVRDQSVETWLGCHRRSFEWFNGVPTRCIIDNPKCAITKACYHEPKVQRAYADYAEGYGFLISPCPVRDPQKKGRVESGVKYVKNKFVPLREFRSLTDANQQLKQWVRDEAGQRIHETVQEKPLTRFTEVEQALLKPLPDKPPLLAHWVNPKCHSDCHIQIEKSFYSVPEIWIGQHLWARVSETLVEIFNEQLLITAHKRLKKPGSRSTVQEHLPSQAKAYYMRDPQWCLAKSKEAGASCHALIEHLFVNRVLDNLRAAQGVIGFRKAYGDKRLEAACERAWAFETPLYKTVKSILRQGLDQQPNDVSATTPLADAYRGDGRYSRDGTDLLPH
ncbi:MAG: IS21 family transposase, partial [Halioglobus sp.]|nr:IS21 family transposase [Halioglobus sp.]